MHPIIISIIIVIIIINLFNDILFESYETIYETVILKINFTSYGDYCPKLWNGVTDKIVTLEIPLSLRKQLTFWTTPPLWFPREMCSEERTEIFHRLVPDLDSASDWLKQMSDQTRPIWSTNTHILIVTSLF